jgi:ADP-ribose pyrophosphatase
MHRVTIHDKRVVFDGFFRVEEALVSYEDAKGHMVGPVPRLSLERGDSVAAVVFHRERRRVILTNQFRYPTNAKGPGWLTELPAGMIDDSESPENAIRREVREECGYEVERLDPIATFYLSPGGSSERIILYYAEVGEASRVSPGGGTDEGESIEVTEARVDDLIRDAMAGGAADAKTLVGLLWLMKMRPDVADAPRSTR